MTDQLAIVYPRPAIAEAFAKFHADNPAVYAELVRLTRQAKVAGRKRIGIGMLFEVVRWNRIVWSRDADGFKLNNSHRSRYARLIMEQEPDLAGMFETRSLHDD